jgi:glycerophosphoryl diester phosphodiesterase
VRYYGRCMVRALPLVAAMLVAPAAHAAIPAVHAHRGGSVIGGVPTYAEETVPAFKNATNNLHVVLELDAKLTKDAVPVVFHDPTLDRTTNCEGLVADRTLEELMAACRSDVLGSPGSGLKTAPASQPVPIATLAEVLALAKKTGATVNLEIKNYPTDKDDWDHGTGTFANRVMDVVLESKIPAKQVILQSFTPDNLQVAERRMPAAEFSFLGLAGSEDFALDVAKTNGWDWVSPSWPVDRDYVDQAHASGIRVVPYTLDSSADVAAAAQARVDALITDDPLMALKTLDKTPPVVRFKLLRTKIRRVRSAGKLRVRVTASEAATVAMNASVAGKRAGVAELNFDRAGSRKATLRLSRAARRALKGRRTAKVVLKAKSRDIAQNGGSTRAVTRLK